MKKITVIGSCVIGLTTAIQLQEAGYEVSILTKALPNQTTSARAAAIWFPFKAKPLSKVNHWSKVSYKVFKALANKSTTGVSLIDFLELAQDDRQPKWVDALPEGAWRKAGANELPQGYSFGNIALVPLIETPIYLAYLLKTFQSNGGTLSLQQVQKLEEIAQPNSLVINCTGLDSRELVGDKTLYPIRGQIVKAEPLEGVLACADDGGPNALAYIIPRADCVILGGTAEEGKGSLVPQKETTDSILKKCTHLQPSLSDVKIIGSEVGLRPGRPTIRLEKEVDSDVIHNYGHGGSGFTVSWGCAAEVLKLVQQFSHTPNQTSTPRHY